MTRRDQILELLRDVGALTTPEVAAALGILPHNAGDLLRSLTEEGAAEPIGGVRPYRWRLCATDNRRTA